MNVSLVSLSISHLSNSPLLAHSSLLNGHKLSIHKSTFKKFFSNAIYEKGSKFNYKLSSSMFDHYLDTSVVIDSEKLLEGYNGNQTFIINETTSFVALDCTWLCGLAQKKSVAIYFQAEKVSDCTLLIESCRFIICIGEEFGAVYFNGGNSQIKDTCFEVCSAMYKYQSFYLCSKKSNSTVQRCHKDRCSGVKPIGGSFTEHVRAMKIVVTDCNHTKSFVKHRRILGSIGLNNNMKYQWNVFVNNSGSSFFGFSTMKSINYIISDCILSHCYCKSTIKGFIEANSPVVVKRFQLYQTKMLFIVTDDIGGDMEKDSEALFVDCVTDTPRNLIKLPGKNVSVLNLTHVEKRTYDMHFDYEKWSCKTPIPPTPLPSPSRTPNPSPSASPWPTMTMFALDFKPVDQEPEMIDLYTTDNEITNSDIIQIIVLIILAIFSCVLFVLAYKKRNKIVIAEDEKEKLLQY